MQPRAPAISNLRDILGEPLLTVPQVAEHLGVHRSTVHRLAGRPDGIPCIKVGGSTRFRPKDVRAYVEKQTIQAGGGDHADQLIHAMVAEGRPSTP